MSTKTLKKNSISFKNMDFETNDSVWSRPSDWLTMPTIGPNDQKCAMLVAIFNTESNYVAFTCAGNYTVDWGDGTSENVNTGVKAQHRYDWANISNTTLTSEGFRQAMVVVTPQAGQTLSTITFQARHDDLTSTNNNTHWLDIKIGITGALTLSNYTTNVSYFPDLRILTIENHQTNISSTLLRGNAQNVTHFIINKAGLNINGSGPFQYSRNLEYVGLNPTITANDCSNLFLQCYNLREAPYFNTSSCVNFSNMFQYCYKLRKVPSYNTSNATSMANMFDSCYSLREVPLFDMTKVTNCSSMFNACYSLVKIPPFSIGGTSANASNMFADCRSLTNIPLLGVTTITNADYMFWQCYSLKTVPALQFNSLNSMTSGMFTSCLLLDNIPNIFTRSGGVGSGMSGAFAGCESLRMYPTITFNSGATTFAAGSLISLREYPALNLQYATTISLSTANKVYRSQLYNCKVTHTYANNMLNKAEINEVIGNLGTAATTQTLTITGNPGANRYPVLSRGSTTTTGSTTITLADTSSFVTGMQVTGTGISDAVSVTFQDAGDTVTFNNHGIANGKLVSFATITSTTGISVYTTYYVINATTNTFQLSLTQGGSAIALTTDGSGTMLYQTLITNIVANTSVTIDIPASASGTVSLSYRNLNTQIAVMKRWSVTG